MTSALRGVSLSEQIIKTYNHNNNNNMSQDSSVGIAMGYGLDDPRSIPSSVRFFSPP
jgi:hypothetical protein